MLIAIESVSSNGGAILQEIIIKMKLSALNLINNLRIENTWKLMVENYRSERIHSFISITFLFHFFYFSVMFLKKL